MATVYKVLGQSNPAATTLTTLYTVPAANNTIVSTVTICNQSATAIAYRIAVQPAGAAIAAQHYLAYDAVVPGNDSISLTMGITMAATDVLSVQANTTSASFVAFGSEIY